MEAWIALSKKKKRKWRKTGGGSHRPNQVNLSVSLMLWKGALVNRLQTPKVSGVAAAAGSHGGCASDAPVGMSRPGSPGTHLGGIPVVGKVWG